MAQIYVAGIHTDAGKTHFSAAFCKAFGYSYFKLIQAGTPTDTQRVSELLKLAQDKECKHHSASTTNHKNQKNNSDTKMANNSQAKICQAKINQTKIHKAKIYKAKIHKEGVSLATPTSPHIAKIRENIYYDKIPLPQDENCLIELAGGLYTPFDEHCCMIDFMRENPAATVLVGRYYLGCINHILLSLQALKQASIKVLCLVMSGKDYKQDDLTNESALIDRFISDYAFVPIVHLPFFADRADDFVHSAEVLYEDIRAKVDFGF